MIDSPSTASRSNPTNEDGISLDSFATRDAAGCSRNCSASKSRPPSVAITISPSTTHPGGSRSSRACVQLRKIAIERLQIAALDVDVVGRAKHDRSKPVPLGFEQQAGGCRDGVDELGEHRLDGRLHQANRLQVTAAERRGTEQRSNTSWPAKQHWRNLTEPVRLRLACWPA